MDNGSKKQEEKYITWTTANLGKKDGKLVFILFKAVGLFFGHV